MSEKRVKIQHIIDSQLPSYVREDFPLIKEFFSFYYSGLEFQGAPIDLVNNIDQYLKLNENANTVDSTLLSSDVNDTQDFIDVYNTDGFPESFGIIQINDEIILYQAKTSTRFLFCKRGFSGITSYDTQNGTEEAVFSESESASHNFRDSVKNLSALFLQEFLKKIKGQFLPGLQTQELSETLNQAQFIRQSRDLYSARGTESSFKILFKALYNVDAQIIRPQDFLISPSNAFYQLTRDLIVEPLEGDPENLINATLFQDEFDNLKRAYAPISYVQKISVGVLTDSYFKVSIDSSYNKYDGSQELLYGEFSSHAKTTIIDSVAIGQTFIDVDSTIGFPKEGTLSVNYKDGTTGIVTYTDKTINQFLGITTGSVIKTILDKSIADQNTYAYGYDTETKTTDGIKVKIRSVLNKLKEPAESYYQTKDSKIKIKSLGKMPSDLKSNNWVLNTAQFYDVESVTIEESTNNIYRLVTKDTNVLKVADQIQLTDSNNVAITNPFRVTDVYSPTTCLIRGDKITKPQNITKASKRISKFNSSLFTQLNNLSTNVQNTYVDGEKVLIASNSLPTFLDTAVGPNQQKFTISGLFTLGQETITLTSVLIITSLLEMLYTILRRKLLLKLLNLMVVLLLMNQ